MPNHSPMVFSSEWGRQVAAAINRSERYRIAGADWCDRLALELANPTPGHPPAAVLDLRHGTCHAVFTDTAARPEEAAFVLSATSARWQELLAGRVEPLWGIMSGRLVLKKGSLAALMPFAEAARVLVQAIATVETVFPPEGETPLAQ